MTYRELVTTRPESWHQTGIPACEIDPVHDPRWPEFLRTREDASVFHSAEWLEALERTYGYHASALVTCGQGGGLTSALVFCRVHSWLTGRRVVSVPFSDHCTPLVANTEELSRLVSQLEQDGAAGRYVELRTLADCPRSPGLLPASTYCLHRLDLRPSLSDVFRACHPNHVRRKIVRAKREGLFYEEGRRNHYYEGSTSWPS